MEQLEDRFWRHVRRSDDAACWPWQGSMRGRYYGRFDLGGKSVLATLVDLEANCYNAGLRRAEYEIGMAQTFVVSARGRILHALQETT